MDIDYSLNAIRIQKTGFFYQGERKVQYSEFKKLTAYARRQKRLRKILKYIYTWANGFSKTTYNYYLEVISMMTAAGEFPSDAPMAEPMEEALLGVRTGKITQKILVGVRTGEISRKTIRDEMVKAVLEGMNWELIDKKQSGSKSLSAPGIGDKETEV